MASGHAEDSVNPSHQIKDKHALELRYVDFSSSVFLGLLKLAFGSRKVALMIKLCSICVKVITQKLRKASFLASSSA